MPTSFHKPAVLAVIVSGLSCLLLAIGLICPPDSAAAAAQLSPMTIHTGKGPVHLQVEIANTPSLRAQGLMFRKSMPRNHGMLFDFEYEHEILMWMKNTPLPLDMIFINRAGHVMSIIRNTKPFSLEVISSGGRAWAVLEINGGSADRLFIKPGNRVEHSLITARAKRRLHRKSK